MGLRPESISYMKGQRNLNVYLKICIEFQSIKEFGEAREGIDVDGKIFWSKFWYDVSISLVSK